MSMDHGGLNPRVPPPARIGGKPSLGRWIAQSDFVFHSHQPSKITLWPALRDGLA
jgi:hypothetical protein